MVSCMGCGYEYSEVCLRNYVWVCPKCLSRHSINLKYMNGQHEPSFIQYFKNILVRYFPKMLVFVDRCRMYMSLIQFVFIILLTIKSGISFIYVLAAIILVPLIGAIDIKLIYGREVQYRWSKNKKWEELVKDVKFIKDKVR